MPQPQLHWCPECGHVISRLYATVNYTSRGYCYSVANLNGNIISHEDHNEEEIDYDDDDTDELEYRCPACDVIISPDAVLDENPGILNENDSAEEISRQNAVQDRVFNILNNNNNNNEPEISGLNPSLLTSKTETHYAAITCHKCGHANIFVDGNSMNDADERNRFIINHTNQDNITELDLECEHCMTALTNRNCTITKYNS